MPVNATTRTATTAHRSATASPLLRQGSRGPSVSRLQHLLRAKGHRIEVDGVFGPKTAAAVRAFQADARIAVDGVVGPQTWGALGVRQTDVTGPSGDGAGIITGRGYRNGQPVAVKLAPVGGGKYLNVRAAGPFRQMMADARRAGVNLTISSAFRSMEQQQHLYNLYRSGRGNLAARPGYSNHQMGLSVDLGGIGGYGTRAYNWLKQNAPRYGFVNDVRGEFWHWTYQR